MPEFTTSALDTPGERYFTAINWFNTEITVQTHMYDILLAHKVIHSGLPNRFGCRIPLTTKWNLQLFDAFLLDYEDREVIEWLKYGFTISRQDDISDPVPAERNHKGATMFPDAIQEYINTEILLGATIGPFKIPPFIGRMVISPLSTRPKKESTKRRIIMDLSFPIGCSVNDGIDKNTYYGRDITLNYPTIDTLAKCISLLGAGCLVWKKDLLHYFRQVPACPCDYSLIGFRWDGLLYFDKYMLMGLRSAAYICQRVTTAIKFAHGQRVLVHKLSGRLWVS